MSKEDKRSKYWNELVEVLEKEFPKGFCKERGHALVLLAYAEIALLKAEKKAFHRGWDNCVKFYGIKTENYAKKVVKTLKENL